MSKRIEGCGLYGAEDIATIYGGKAELPTPQYVRTDVMGNKVAPRFENSTYTGIPTGPGDRGIKPAEGAIMRTEAAIVLGNTEVIAVTEGTIMSADTAVTVNGNSHDGPQANGVGWPLLI